MSGGVLSDLDGVLVDSAGSVERAWRWWAQRHGLDAAAVLANVHGTPSQETIRRLAPELDAGAESRVIEARQARDGEDVVALAGARRLLAEVRPLAVVTSGTVLLARARLRAAGLVLGDVPLITIERVARGKPAPDAYLLGARELGLEPARCTVLEDAPAGVAAGRAAGMRVVGLTTTHAAGELRQADVLFSDVGAWLDGER